MAFSDVEENISHLHLHPGARVADFGAGSGAVSFALSRKVGGTGHVYAIDVQKEMLAKLKAHANEQHFRNIEVLWANCEERGGTRLADASLDAVVLSNVLFQADDREGMVGEAKRLLKPGGELLVVDWSASFGGMGPAPEHVLPEQKAREVIESAGLRFVSGFHAGAHHYGLLYTS